MERYGFTTRRNR